MNKNLMRKVIFTIFLTLAVLGYSIFNNIKANAALQQITFAEKTNSVIIKDYAFNPANIRIKKGDTVTWKNEDIIAHKIKSDTFGSNDMVNGTTYQYKFENTGTFNYICSIHPSMKGMIIVEDKL